MMLVRLFSAHVRLINETRFPSLLLGDIRYLPTSLPITTGLTDHGPEESRPKQLLSDEKSETTTCICFRDEE